MSDRNNSNGQDSRVYPTHLNESLFFYNMRQESILVAIQELSAEFMRRYKKIPDLIFVNTFLVNIFDKEVAAAKGRQTLCIDDRDVIFFYCSPEHEQHIPHASYILVAHTQLSGAACSL